MKKILNIVFGLIIMMNLSCSKTYEFRAPVDPEAANLSKPANNTQCLEIDNVTFEWNKSENTESYTCLLYTSPSPRDQRGSGMAGCA